jgi:hypothetical protein
MPFLRAIQWSRKAFQSLSEETAADSCSSTAKNSLTAESRAGAEKSVSFGTAYGIRDDQLSKDRYPRRSENKREADVLAKPKDAGEVARLGAPASNASVAGVLRLHSRFASQTGYSAQDDSFTK